MLDADLLIPATEHVGILLGAGLVGAVAAERRALRAHQQTVLLRRWGTWMVAAPLFIAAAAGPAIFTALFVALCGVQAAREYAHITALGRKYRAALLLAAGVTPLVALAAPAYWFALPAAMLVAATVLPLLEQDVEVGPLQAAGLALGYTCIPWLLSFMVLLHGIHGGEGILLDTGLGVALGDIGAYAAGRIAGHRRLAPRVSPNKTWAGLAGQGLGALAGVGMMWSVLPESLTPGRRLALVAVVAVGAVWGDLLESLLKRHRGFKDAGEWLPGFGGLLDRIDSLLLALPLAYLVVTVR